MECSDGKSAETGSGSSIQWPLPDTGGVCRCFVLVHAVTGDTRHTGDIETRRWCNQLSDSSPHHISFQPSSQLPRPNLNTNTWNTSQREGWQTNSRVYFQHTRACNYEYTSRISLLSLHNWWQTRIYFPNLRNWFDGFFTLMWFASRMFFSTKHSIKIFLSLLRFLFCFSLYLG